MRLTSERQTEISTNEDPVMKKGRGRRKGHREFEALGKKPFGGRHKGKGTRGREKCWWGSRVNGGKKTC